PPPGAKPTAPATQPSPTTRQLTGDVMTGAITIDGAAMDTSLGGLDVGLEAAEPGSEPNYKILKATRARKLKGKKIPGAPIRLDRPLRFTLGVPMRLDAGNWELVVTADAAPGQVAPV